MPRICADEHLKSTRCVGWPSREKQGRRAIVATLMSRWKPADQWCSAAGPTIGCSALDASTGQFWEFPTNSGIYAQARIDAASPGNFPEVPEGGVIWVFAVE